MAKVGVLDHRQVTQRVQGPVHRRSVNPWMARLHSIRQLLHVQVSTSLSQLL